MAKGLVRIRLARFGRKHSPVYNIVVANAHKATHRKPIEVIGTYNPIPTPLTNEEIKKGVLPIKNIELDFQRTKYWIGVGAQPSETVTRLLKKCGILDERWGKKHGPDRRVLQPMVEIFE